MSPERLAILSVPYTTASGKTLALVFNHRAKIHSEKSGIHSAGSQEQAAIVLWSSLIVAQPNFTLEDACDLIDEESMANRSVELFDAVQESQARYAGKTLEQFKADLKKAEEEANPQNPESLAPGGYSLSPSPAN